MSSVDRQREFAVDVVRQLQEAGFRALWNGGCVRDFLMGRAPKDYDVATDARPDDVRSLFGHRRTLAVGASFGVIIVLGPKQAGNVEVATFRTEGPYLDGRRPEHVDFATPEEDAQRRDFTINGMFYDPISEQVHDYVGGEKDLAAGVVRAIGRPADRMAEDKLRMLRAVRFAATLDFQLDAATADAVRAMAPEIHVVSAERIAQELKKMLVDPHRRRAIELAHETQLLLEILPELKPVLEAGDGVAWEAALRRLRLLQDQKFELATAALLAGVPNISGRQGSKRNASTVVHAVCKRLRLSNQETGTIEWLLAHLPDVLASTTKSLAQLKRMLSHPDARDLLELARVDRLAADGDLAGVMHCEELLHRTPPEKLDPPPFVTGDDLIALGLKPGKQFREILDAVREAQLNEELSTREEAMGLVQRLIAKPPENRGD
ncbi:MAG TPA: CCA tRNA nucleotidyltransferase [Planctomycetaceae bacterium]|jgi:poly(A) polymerase|nr:CCA tRNA nucleotidyltransferase [Planctomycetaceae bacterium]